MKLTTFIRCIFFILVGCTSSKMSTKQVNQAAFPPEFGYPDQILLIEKRVSGINHGGINNYLEKSFTKNYGGKFVLVSEDEILNDPKYSDSSVYRFVLSDQVWASKRTSATRRPDGIYDYTNQYSYQMDFHLFDRKENKDYPYLGVSTNVVGRAINRAATLLNGRLKN